MSYVATPFYGGTTYGGNNTSLAAATAIGAGLSFIGGLASNAINKDVANQNIAFQREANAQNLALTREMNERNIAFQQQENAITRSREDNAVQRAAADMQAAGLSKTLAAGNPASAAALNAPSVKSGSVNAVSNGFKYESALQKMNIASLMLDMASKNQQLKINDKLADAQIAAYDAQIANLAANTAHTESTTIGQNIANGNAQRAADDTHLYVNSQITLNKSTQKVNEYKAELTRIESENFVRELDARIANYVSGTDLNNANAKVAYAEVGKINNEVLEIIKRTEYLGSQIDHMNASTKLLVEQYVTEKIRQFSAIHDIGYAVHTGLPVGVTPSGLIGGVTTSAETMVNEASGALGNIPYYDTNAWQENLMNYVVGR